MKRAIYPGSFDPITYGHIDIVQRSINIFDELIIAVGVNENKRSLFSSKERARQIEEVFHETLNVKVITFDKMLVDLAKDLGVFTIIRGLRAVSDFEFEFQLSAINKKMEPRVESIFMMTKENNLYLSSSIVKEIASMKGDVSDFVPQNVASDLIRKFRNDNKN